MGTMRLQQATLAAPASTVLHVTNGDSVAGTMRLSDMAGTITVWADVLHEGPAPAGLEGGAWRAMRSEFLADAGWGNRADIRRTLDAWDAAMSCHAADDGEIILWLEHDLFDQLLLIRHLDWFARRPSLRDRLHLICIGTHPDIPRFKGLGQLNAEQLAALLPIRTPVSDDQIALAQKAWVAFRSPDPMQVQKLVDRLNDTAPLPYLRAALVRHLMQFPAEGDGLSMTERFILEALNSGSRTFAQIFQYVNRREPAPFMGDSTLALHVRRLAEGEQPLLSIDDQTHALTPAGARVLAGEADRVELLPLNHWLGGVRLQGRDCQWRWSHQDTRLRSANV